MKPKNKRRQKRVKRAKHKRHGFAFCIVGSGNVTRCNVCLGVQRVGRTKMRTQMQSRSS